MRKIESKVSIVDVPVSLVCDKCKREYFYDNIEDRLEIQEFVKLDLTGGYNSVWGDGAIVLLDLCQRCSKAVFGEWVRVSKE